MQFTLLSLHLCEYPLSQKANNNFYTLSLYTVRLLNTIFQDFQVVLFRKSLGEVLPDFPPASHVNHFIACP